MNRIALIAALAALGLSGWLAFDKVMGSAEVANSAAKRITDLELKFDGLQKTIAALGGKTESAPAAAGGGGALETRVAVLEERLGKLTAELEPLLQMIRQQAGPQVDTANLTPEKNAEYLAAYEKQDGVQKTASGILYKVLKSGPDGAKKPAGPTAVVTVHYEGKFVDGTVFDSSLSRGEPIEFPLNEVIPGWTEIVQMMKEGDSWEVVIPAALAYGEEGRPPQMPGGQVLTFRIDLIKAG
jgi:FKBP-type peptidyl-prolyl cis-trans isomerase